LIWIQIGLEFRKDLEKIKNLFQFFYQPGHPTGSRPGKGSSLNATAAPVTGPPCHPHRLDPVANSWPHRTHTKNPEPLETELDSTLDSKNQNLSRVKKSPLQNPNKLRWFGTQTHDRIDIESKLPTLDPSPYK
jgi:hypothetical protein